MQNLSNHSRQSVYYGMIAVYHFLRIFCDDRGARCRPLRGAKAEKSGCSFSRRCEGQATNKQESSTSKKSCLPGWLSSQEGDFHPAVAAAVFRGVVGEEGAGLGKTLGGDPGRFDLAGGQRFRHRRRPPGCQLPVGTEAVKILT